MQYISSEWKSFCDQFINDEGYWYIPKGLTIKDENFPLIQQRLNILKKYEGKNWTKVQSRFVKELIKNDLFDQRVFHDKKSDNAAIGRMFKVVISTLGLAWVNEEENVFITEIGNKILKAKNNRLSDIIQNQVKKYQFYNPGFQKKQDFLDFKINPVHFVSRVFIEGNFSEISREEYILFFSRKRTIEDIRFTVQEIKRFRGVDQKSQNRLIRDLSSKKIKNANDRRSSIFNTIMLESPYALNFIASSGLFHYQDSKLTLAVSTNVLKKEVNQFDRFSIWIDFSSYKDWFYYFGSDSFKSSIHFAIDYYADISDIENALKVYSEAKKRKMKLPELKLKEDAFKTVLVDEKILEDFLEKHVSELERDLVLVKGGRQFPTLSGPIDLLAKDSKGNYVVIELKKGKLSDKVIGQVTRYVSFVAQNVTSAKKVRAIIVGKNIDQQLCISVRFLKFICSIYEFDYKVKFSKKA